MRLFKSILFCITCINLVLITFSNSEIYLEQLSLNSHNLKINGVIFFTFLILSIIVYFVLTKLTNWFKPQASQNINFLETRRLQIFKTLNYEYKTLNKTKESKSQGSSPSKIPLQTKIITGFDFDDILAQHSKVNKILEYIQSVQKNVIVDYINEKQDPVGLFPTTKIFDQHKALVDQYNTIVSSLYLKAMYT